MANIESKAAAYLPQGNFHFSAENWQGDMVSVIVKSDVVYIVDYDITLTATVESILEPDDTIVFTDRDSRLDYKAYKMDSDLWFCASCMGSLVRMGPSPVHAVVRYISNI